MVQVPGTILDVEIKDRFASSQIRHDLNTAEGRYAALLQADGRRWGLFIFFKELSITIAEAICVEPQKEEAVG